MLEEGIRRGLRRSRLSKERGSRNSLRLGGYLYYGANGYQDQLAACKPIG